MQSRDIRYTVVLTAYNEERHIRQTISALTDQIDVEPGSLEILLVDDNSNDATVAQALAADCDFLTILDNQRTALSELTTRQQALDLGFRHARGDIILTLDADGRPGRDWVSKMTRPVTEGRADAVAGPVGFVPQSGWISAWQSSDVCYYLLVSSIINRFGYAGGILFGNFAFRAALYRDTGGYTSMGFALTEDLQFGRAIHAMGRKIVYCDRRCMVEYQPCRNFSSLVERTVRVSSGAFSTLAAVLTVLPLTLLVTLISAVLIGGVAAWFVLAVRYFLGVGFVMVGQLKLGKQSNWPAAFCYEPVVFALAPAVLIRVLRGNRIAWGMASMSGDFRLSKPGRKGGTADKAVIRPLEPGDRQAVRDICCRTAFRNRGCKVIFEDKELHADYWTKYYTDYAPEASWVVEEDGVILGFLLGSTDQNKFLKIMGRRIVPPYIGKALWRYFTRQYKQPQSGRYLRWLFMKSWREAPNISYGDYPAHYHCNILRAGYGRGYYTTLTLLFLDHLEQNGIMSLHGHITENKEKGIWDRFGNTFQSEHADYFAEKPSSLFRFVTGDDNRMVNRAWGIQTYKYRKWILWLKESYSL